MQEPLTTVPGAAPHPMERWTQDGRDVLDPAGRVAATLRTREEARRFVAAINAVAGMPTDALEAWSTGVINDPVHELAAELEALLEFAPYPGERRKGERRQGDRRRAATQVRIEERP
jgi:hypothetical protein